MTDPIAEKPPTNFHVYFGGGRIVAPNGIRMTYNDTDRVVFDGTVFEATQERANYFNFAKAKSSNVVVAESGEGCDGWSRDGGEYGTY